MQSMAWLLGNLIVDTVFEHVAYPEVSQIFKKHIDMTKDMGF